MDVWMQASPVHRNPVVPDHVSVNMFYSLTADCIHKQRW